MSDIGHIIGHRAAEKALLIHEVLLKLMEKGPGVHVVAGGWGKDLCIPGPAQTFIALRTVSGHVNEVGLEPPDGIFIQPVDLLIPGMNLSGPVHIRIEHAAAEHVRSHFPDPARHTDIAKSKERETGTDRAPDPI